MSETTYKYAMGFMHGVTLMCLVVYVMMSAG